MVIIKDMDKPKNCHSCELFDNLALECRRTHNVVDIDECRTKRDDDCPIIEWKDIIVADGHSCERA